MPIFLKHLLGSKADQIESFDLSQIRVGRQGDNDLRFDPQRDTSVSGYHAEIYMDGGRYMLKDLQSTNGTFLNSRKIDKPVPLKDGDEIQFSARGPKVVFLTKDPAFVAEPDLPRTAENAPTEVFSAEAVKAETTPSKKSSISWQKFKPYLPVVSLSAVSAVLLAGGLFFFDFTWWRLLIGAGIVLLVAGGAYLGWKYWTRRKAVAEQKDAAHEQREISLGRGNKDNLQELKKKWADVVRSLRESKLHRSGEDPIYALPWFLVIGEAASGKSALIKSAGPLSSVVSPGGDGPTRNCDWWFFHKLVVLDTSGRYVFHAKESEAAGEWRTLLGELRLNRRNEPLNGVLVALPADALASRSLDKLKEQAGQIRERLDEITHTLGVKFPVYLIFSKCDLIPGFSECFDALPEPLRGQAFGYLNPEAFNGSDPFRFFDKAVRTIVDRLARVRLAVLREAERAEFTRGMFLFPAEVKSLQLPIKAMMEILFRPSPYRDAPFCRGILFTSVRRSGAPISRLAHVLGTNYKARISDASKQEMFARDLFSTILANDRSLVSRTSLSHERTKMTRSAGLIGAISAALLVCGLFTWSFKNNLEALRALNISTCAGSTISQQRVLQNLRLVDECRNAIENFVPDTTWEKLAMNFGLAQWRQVGAALHARFSEFFSSTVLNPIDSAIDNNLASGSGSPLLLGVVFQRMRLLTRCHENGRCSFGTDAAEVNYAGMLSPLDSQIKDGHAAVDVFRRDYESFLLWQREASAYERMKNKDSERIEGWIKAGGLSRGGIVSSANESFPPIRASDFWDVSSRLHVEGAYTMNGWKKGIEPLLLAVKQFTSGGADRKHFETDVSEFEAKYKREMLQKWGDFLSRFVEVQPRIAAPPRDLVLTLIGSNSPYQAVLRSANENVNGIIGASISDHDLPPWEVLLKAYSELKGRLDAPPKNDRTSEKDKEALSYLAVYLDALKQLPAKLSTPQDSFIAAQNAFREGEAVGKPAQPISQAIWALKMLKTTERFKYRDTTFWTFLERPVDIALTYMLREAGEHLQQQWRQIYLANSGDDVPPGVKAAKVMEFVNNQGAGFLKPERNGHKPNTINGQSVSFSQQFLVLLSTLTPDSLSGTYKMPERIISN